MPALLIYGVPEDKTGLLSDLTNELIGAVCSVPELKLDRTSVSCIYPKDLRTESLGEEIIIFVDCLTKKPDRTAAVRGRLAVNIVKAVAKYFPDANLIECFVRPFDRNNGFAGMRIPAEKR